jgi:hypothetical protein
MPEITQRLKLHLEWEDPCGAKGDDLRATWCRFTIKIGDVSVTRVFDQRAQTVRDAIYCPAYPLAEWLVYNWWPLLHEAKKSESVNSDQRHNIRFASEGFALPDLEFFSEDPLIRARWKPLKPHAAPVQFLEQGSALLAKDHFACEIHAYLDTVCARLEAAQRDSNPLCKEWRAVVETKEKEREFCQFSGALGVDPYAVDAGKAQEIIAVEKELPNELKREFFLAANPDALNQQSNWVKKCLKGLETLEVKTVLAGKRGDYRQLPAFPTAWESGYKMAEKFRKDFNLGSEESPVHSEDLCKARKGYLPVIKVLDGEPLGAVARLDSPGGPQVAMAKERETGKKFLLARALCDYRCANGENWALLTSIRSDRQKRNRAFAAQVLAPAAGIGKHLSGSRTTVEEIGDIASHFEVSEWLIIYQIQNHHLADIEGIDMLASL